jgi:hypothetical protein
MPEQVLSAEKRPAEKPFPWRCPKCRQLTVTRVTMPYSCKRTLGSRIVTVDVPNLAVPRCSNCGEVVFDYAADEQIRAAFRTQYGPENSIDDTFISYWHPKYDETETDEPEYRRLVDTVRIEMESVGSLTEQTFTDILDWKAARVKGRIDWQNIEGYLNTISRCREAQNAEKMRLLVELPGIAVPVASTILHFIYPSVFPIMDQRTVEVLRHFGYIEHKSRDLKRYPAFMQAIASIQKCYPRWDLRAIDRALFAYHKQVLGALGQNGCLSIFAGNRTAEKAKGTA